MSEWPEGLENFKAYLPKYLSPEAQAKLFAELDQFPENIDGRLYTIRLVDDPGLFQGDGLAELWVTNLPDPKVGMTRVMVISNTCDIDPANKRLIGYRLMYCPIIHLSKYEQLIRSKGQSGFDPSNHLKDIRLQLNSAYFYLPSNAKLGEESIAMLDRINNCDAQAVDVEALVRNRLFTLSDYGFYLFLFKLSIHLTRIREGVSRTS